MKFFVSQSRQWLLIVDKYYILTKLQVKKVSTNGVPGVITVASAPSVTYGLKPTLVYLDVIYFSQT